MRKASLIFIGTIALVTFSLQSTFAQTEKKVMSVVDFLNVPGLSSPQLSPDGKELIYIYSESNWDENKQIGHVWRVGTDGKDPRQMTAGKEGEGNARWSPDGRFISFITKRDDDENNQLYLMRADGGEGIRLTDHSTTVSAPQWSADSKFLIVYGTPLIRSVHRK